VYYYYNTLVEKVFMLLDIDHHSGIPIYRQIIDQVREQIMAGLLKEGEQLMPVRELSEQLAVNPMTVSKAYSALEAEGLLERSRGIGLFISGIHSGRKEQNKEAAVEALLSKAVTTAMQYGLSQKKIQKMLEELFAKYQSEKRRKSDE
jgi:GntR family transcriptional regulator